MRLEGDIDGVPLFSHFFARSPGVNDPALATLWPVESNGSEKSMEIGSEPTVPAPRSIPEHRQPEEQQERTWADEYDRELQDELTLMHEEGESGLREASSGDSRLRLSPVATNGDGRSVDQPSGSPVAANGEIESIDAQNRSLVLANGNGSRMQDQPLGHSQATPENGHSADLSMLSHQLQLSAALPSISPAALPVEFPSLPYDLVDSQPGMNIFNVQQQVQDDSIEMLWPSSLQGTPWDGNFGGLMGIDATTGSMGSLSDLDELMQEFLVSGERWSAANFALED